MPNVPEFNLSGFTMGRIVLRPWTLADRDIATVLQAAHDPEIARFSSVVSATTPELATQWIRQRDEADRLDWAIASADDAVGRVSLAHIDQVDGVGEFGYWLLPSHRGIGLASAAVRTVERHAFETLGLGRLVIRHELVNDRSCLLARRCGYLEEGIQRGAFERRGRRLDMHVHARLASDPSAL